MPDFILLYTANRIYPWRTWSLEIRNIIYITSTIYNNILLLKIDLHWTLSTYMYIVLSTLVQVPGVLVREVTTWRL
jgi:hypothetical protein